MIWNRYKNFRDFGWIVGSVLLAIGLYPLYKEMIPHWWLVGIALGLLTTSFIYPPLLEPFYRLWMKFGKTLGWLNTRILLAIIFYGIFTPLGLFMRLLGKDPLQKKPNVKETTSWREYQSINPIELMKYQF